MKVRELSGHLEQGVSLPKKYKYYGKLGAWTSEVWREVYKLPKTSPESYIMKGKVQFSELQVLKLMKGDKWQSKSGVLIEQVKGTPDFIQFCQLLNPVFASVRPKHFQHNQLAFYHYAWLAISDPSSPMLD
ncbi:hypothetical protein R1flu_011754 [Riccia fluitans]|uniref:LAGLIDADG homing endonuclease n=1 Tax=Riccia fluitans TaxID=41844 RepID=A0ABD1ZBZ3_9MARC